jgi:polyisoprenoid-binding protein YceI
MSKWQIDTAHATASFKVKHLGLSWVPGQIYGITGNIEFEPGNLAAAKFDAEIDLTTLTTGQPMRDGHLKSADFFDVEKYPKMQFESTSVTKVDDTHFELVGNLTIKSTAKEVKITGEFLGETDKTATDGSGAILRVAAFTLHTSVDRRDFGLNWNIDLPGGKLLVGNEVEITVEVEAIKQ